MGRILYVIFLTAALLSGCSGIQRLSEYAQNVKEQEKDERLQEKRYLELKRALQAGLKHTDHDSIVHKYGKPNLEMNEQGKIVSLYRENFSLCAEKIYILFNADDNTLISYTVVDPCKKP